MNYGHIRIGDSPLAGDAFVDQGFTVGEEGGDLSVENPLDLSTTSESIIEKFHKPFLLKYGRQRDRERPNFGGIGAGEIGGALSGRLEVIPAV